MGAGAAVDCEAFTGSWWGQPVNTVTSFAFIAAAAVIWWRRRDLPSAVLVAMVGVGSVAFHGPMPPWGEALHDLSIVWTLVWILAVDLDRKRWLPWAWGVATLFSLTPAIADPIQAVLAVAVLLVELRVDTDLTPRRWAIGILAIGALVGRLSRTGWPLCDPESLWQGHGLWHIAAATALAIWAISARAPSRRTIPTTPPMPG